MENIESSGFNKNLRMVKLEGVFSTAYTYLTTPFLVVFAVLLGANNFELGLLVAINAFFGLIGQIPSARLVQLGSDRKKIAAFASLFSRVVWIPIALLPVFFPGTALIALMILVSLSAFLASIYSPAWVSIMGDIVPVELRSSYFGSRNRLMAIATILVLIFSVLVLSCFSKDSFVGYWMFFGIAGFFGLLCFIFIKKLDDPGFEKEEIIPDISQSIKNLVRQPNFKIFVIFYLILNLGIGIASPFWHAYVLNNLNAHPMWVSAITFSLALGTLISMGVWGRVSNKFGNRASTIISTLGIALVPFVWLFVFSPEQAVLANFFAGIVWGGFNLSIFNYLLDITPKTKRPMYIAVIASIVGIPTFIGPLLGGVFAGWFSGFSFMFLDDLKMVFLASGIIRLVSLVFLVQLEEPRTERFSSYFVFRNIILNEIPSTVQQTSSVVVLKSKTTAQKILDPISRVFRDERARIKNLDLAIETLLFKTGLSLQDRKTLSALKHRIDFELNTFRYLEKKIGNMRDNKKRTIFEKEFLDRLEERIHWQKQRISSINELIQKIARKF